MSHQDKKVSQGGRYAEGEQAEVFDQVRRVENLVSDAHQGHAEALPRLPVQIDEIQNDHQMRK